MLTPWEEHTLRSIEHEMDLGDQRFAEGFRTGRPREPCEYRRRRQWASMSVPVGAPALLFTDEPPVLIGLLVLAVLVGWVGWCRQR